MNYLSKLLDSFRGLGMRRTVLLGVVATVVLGLMTGSILMLSKAPRQVLYSGLDSEDVSRIGAALSEVGISFDVDENGTTVLVEYGRTAQARMILATKGLPKGEKSGYELFDQMGSLGLTSFMQQVTRVRALEGELVRTIQQLDGVKAARVHLAIKSEGAFRNASEQPSASVVVRADDALTPETAKAIRHIVAAAIPGLRVDQVQVMTTDGQLLSAGGEGEVADTTNMLDLETRVAKLAQDRIDRTLAPILGVNNFRTSVVAKLDIDKRQTTQTKYDPDSKVERSLKTSKSSDQTVDNTSDQAVTAEQNVPTPVETQNTGNSSSKKSENKEETVNYEVDTTQTAVVSQGYDIERLAVAVAINKKALPKPESGTPEDQMRELEALVRSAAGVDDKRNDTLQVTAIDFIQDDASMEPVAEPGFMEMLMGNLGAIINGASVLGAVLLIILLGLRPTLKTLIESNGSNALPGPMDGGATPAFPPFEAASALDSAALDSSLPVSVNVGSQSVDMLNKVVGVDVDRAAQVLKRWLEKDEKSAA
jgi:flagellar M-ring protein FliF